MLPAKLLVLGDDPVARSLHRTLGLFIEDCRRCPLDESKLLTVGTRNQALTIDEELGEFLSKCLTVVCPSVRRNMPAGVVSLVDLLRTDTAASPSWMGRFLALVQSEKEKRWLESSCLFSTRSKLRPFGKTRGHAVMTSSASLPSILRTLCTIPLLGGVQWKKWKETSPAADRIGPLTRKASVALAEDCAVDDVRTYCGEILTCMEEGDPEILFDHGNEMRGIGHFVKRYRSLANPWTRNECLPILAEAREFTARTWRGGTQ